MKSKVIIIGAGPGGVQLAYFLERNNIDYLVLEKNDKAASFFEKFPIHRKLISINKVYTGFDDPEVNLRFDWNSLLSEDYDIVFKNFSKEYFPNSDVFVEYVNRFSEHHNLKIKYNTEVKEITKSKEFEIKTDKQNYNCDYLVIATGLSKPNIPNLANIELCKNYVDLKEEPDRYTGRRVLILGKANSAFETADSLTPYATLIHCISPTPLRMAWESHFVGHLRAINNNFLDTYQLKSQNAVINGEVTNIEFRNAQFFVTVAYKSADGEVEELVYDDIINCTGFKFDDSIFDDTSKPELGTKSKWPTQNSCWESTNVEDLYFAGTITQMRDYKKSTSGFIHGFRYNSKCLYHILDEKINNTEWESDPEEIIVPESIARKIITNVNRSSSIWQQFGFIGHVIALDKARNISKYFYDVPVQYLHDNFSSFSSWYLVITLEYGDEIFAKANNVFAVERVHKDDIENAHLSAFLHPIIREYDGKNLISTHHVIEDFESNWNEESTHIAPLLKYLENRFSVIKRKV